MHDVICGFGDEGAVVEWAFFRCEQHNRDVKEYVRPRSYERHYLATHLRHERAGGDGSRGFSARSFYYRSFSMQMSSAEAIDAT